VCLLCVATHVAHATQGAAAAHAQTRVHTRNTQRPQHATRRASAPCSAARIRLVYSCCACCVCCVLCRCVLRVLSVHVPHVPCELRVLYVLRVLSELRCAMSHTPTHPRTRTPNTPRARQQNPLTLKPEWALVPEKQLLSMKRF